MLGGISIVGCARFLRLHWKSGDVRNAADSGALQQRFRRVNLHESIRRSLQNGAEAEADAVILPTLMGKDRRTYAAIFSFMAGVTPPMPVLRRSFVGPEAYYRVKQGVYDLDRAFRDFASYPPIASEIIRQQRLASESLAL